MSERIVAGFCEDNCKFEVYTKEEIIGLLEYVIANNALPADIISGGEVTTSLAAVNAIIEQNKGRALRIWVGTQAEFDAYTGDKTDLYAIISDDQTLQELLDKVKIYDEDVKSFSEALNNITDGIIAVPKAKEATKSGQSDYSGQSTYTYYLNLTGQSLPGAMLVPTPITRVMSINEKQLSTTFSFSAGEIGKGYVLANISLTASQDLMPDETWNFGLVNIPAGNGSDLFWSFASIRVADEIGTLHDMLLGIRRNANYDLEVYISNDSNFNSDCTYTLTINSIGV